MKHNWEEPVYLYIFVSGVDAEGLYRIAGLHDEVECIRMAFDKGKAYLLYYGMMGCCGRDGMVVGFMTTYAISAYHH